MLKDIKVVEYATYIAAPSAGGMLADWGADVIKIEAIGGDPIRKFFGTIGVDSATNPVFDLDNRGKRGIAIDTSTKDGVKILKKLVETADVFLTNVRPGGLERSGLDWPSLQTVNPKLIYASVSGYGLEGDERDRPGFDMAAFWARAGVARLTIPKGEDPFALRTAFGDHVTGMATVSGILAAIIDRQNTGKGRLVETSLLRTGIYSLGSDYAIQLNFGRVASTKGRHETTQPLNNFFKTKDENWLCILPRQSNSEWYAIAKAVGRPELAEDKRFETAKDRKANSEELIDELDRAFGSRTLDDWWHRLDEEDIIWAPVQTPAQVVADPQARAAGAFTEMTDSQGATHQTPAGPVRFQDIDKDIKGPAPDIGEHTDSVLSEYGFSDDDIKEFHNQGVVA